MNPTVNSTAQERQPAEYPEYPEPVGRPQPAGLSDSRAPAPVPAPFSTLPVPLPPVTMRAGGGLGVFLAKVGAVAAKDLAAELQGREVFSTMTVFSALAVLIFGMAFDLRVPEAEMVVPGVLWVIILFAGVLGLNRSFGAETDRGTLPALLLAPMDRSAIYFGKAIANFVFTLGTAAVILVVMFFIFDTPLLQPLILLVTTLGTLGFVCVGTIFAALTASVRARESLLPILLLPVMVPVFMAGVAATAGVLDGGGLDQIANWLWLLMVFDLLFLVVAWLLFDLILEEV